MNNSTSVNVWALIVPLGLAGCIGHLVEPEGERGSGPGVGPGAGAGSSIPGNGGSGAGIGAGGAGGSGAGVGAGGGGGVGAGGGVTPKYQPLSCTTKAVGPSPLRRMTHAEYDNAV